MARNITGAAQAGQTSAPTVDGRAPRLERPAAVGTAQVRPVDARLLAYRTALRTGGDEYSAAVTADATMILVARERQRTDPGVLQERTLQPELCAHDLVRLSAALASPVVHTVREHFRAAVGGSPS
ncbi:hypothetical protein [Streptomyces sp. NPDC001568]|uniref:hypothetical protein n=1 Tax=Streptomyces sp. NPDC001568 TaxID=3364588 RepID=UPI0036A30C5D